MKQGEQPRARVRSLSVVTQSWVLVLFLFLFCVGVSVEVKGKDSTRRSHGGSVGSAFLRRGREAGATVSSVVMF